MYEIEKTEILQHIVIRNDNGIFAVKEDGSIACRPTLGNNDNSDIETLREWKELIGLYQFKARVIQGVEELNPNDYISGSEYRDIIVGLKMDGTLLVYEPGWGDKHIEGISELGKWKNIKQIDIGYNYLAGVTYNGTVCYSKRNKTFTDLDWDNIKKVVVGRSYIIGLKYDGTLVKEGNFNNGRYTFDMWTDIIDIVSLGVWYDCIIGLKRDGSIVLDGNTEKVTGIPYWKNIIALFKNDGELAGLRKDGTIVLSRHPNRPYYDLDYSAWSNIVSIFPSYNDTVAVSKDGNIHIDKNMRRSEMKLFDDLDTYLSNIIENKRKNKRKIEIRDEERKIGLEKQNEILQNMKEFHVALEKKEELSLNKIGSFSFLRLRESEKLINRLEKLIKDRNQYLKYEVEVDLQYDDICENAEKFRRLYNAANQGDAQAQWDLSLEYYYSGRKEEYKCRNVKALYWLERASFQGFAKAQTVLGIAYSKHENDVTEVYGLPHNSRLSYKLINAAANQGLEGARTLIRTFKDVNDY